MLKNLITTYFALKGVCHDDFVALGQFFAKIVT